ncbi:kinase [Nocardia takedensis]|uniref:kinase n=1 Tax=Nocardia takedensis TaxID=259390 RepID=UPI000A0164B5|nr:kinase [Nocardia takedensis]
MRVGIVLYGAPASGKDTVTAELTRQDPRFHLFERVKDGPGRTTGYRIVSPKQFDQLLNSGELIWSNTRYNARYAIDRPGMLHLFERGHIPIVHAGQPGVIQAVQAATPDVRWLVVELRTDRETASARIAARATGDTDARLRAWDETPNLTTTDLTIDTTVTSASSAAKAISSLVA